MSSDEPPSAVQIVDQLKSQGLFDRIRKQCLEDLDTNEEYQVLNNRVNSFVSAFLQKQTWSPTTEKLKLREQIRNELLKTKTVTSGVDKLVRQAVRVKLPKGFREQIQKIVCGYFGINPDSLKFLSKKSQFDECRPVNYLETIPNISPVDNSFPSQTNLSPMTASAQPVTQASYIYPFNTLPAVQPPNIQTPVPCPFIGPSSSYMVPPPNLFYQPMIPFNNQTSIPLTPNQNVIPPDMFSPSANAQDLNQVRTQPVEVTVEESVQCDDPMDIESSNSGSPIDPKIISPIPDQPVPGTQMNSDSVIVSNEFEAKSSQPQSSQLVWHGVHLTLDDVSEDEDKFLHHKSGFSKQDIMNRNRSTDSLSLSNKAVNINNSPPSYRTIHKLTTAESRLDLISGLSDRDHKHKNVSELDLSPVSVSPNFSSKKTDSKEYDLGDLQPKLSASLRYQKNFDKNPQSINFRRTRSSQSPHSFGLIREHNQTSFVNSERRSRVENHDVQNDFRSYHQRTKSPSNLIRKKYVPYSPLSHSNSHSYESRKSSNRLDVPDRHSKYDHNGKYTSSRRLYSPYRPHSKEHQRKSVSPFTSSHERMGLCRNESRSPDHNSITRSSSFNSNSNKSGSCRSKSSSSSSNSIPYHPTRNPEHPHSHSAISNRDIIYGSPKLSRSPELDLDKLTRKREIEARLREIESTERRLLTKRHTHGYDHSNRMRSTHFERSGRVDDYHRNSKKFQRH